MEETTVAKTLKYLMDKRHLSVAELSVQTGIPKSTLYSMVKKQTNQADLSILKTLADFFGEDVSIFCGLDHYKPPIKLANDEQILLTIFRTLNKTGQESLKSYIDVLSGNPGMKK